MSNDIEDQKEELKLMADKEVGIQAHIVRLRGQIEEHKEEITGRDCTIGEKERKIYDLKKRKSV